MPRILLLVLVLLAAGALAFLLVGPGGIGPGAGGERGGDREGAGAPGPRVDGRPEDVGGEVGRDGPILFGRPVAERVGRGGIQGRIAKVAESERPLHGAHLVLEGEGFGGEPVLRRAESGEDGAFAFADVPAGGDYLLGVEVEGVPARTRGGVAVRDGTVTDLGTVWLGERAPLVGVVRGPNGIGVAGARVGVHEGHVSMTRVLRDIGEFFSRLEDEPEPVARAVSDRDGSFRLPDLDPGPVTVVAHAPGFGVGILEAVVVAAGEDAADWVVELPAGRILEGAVVTPEGRGVAGARVAVMENDAFQGLLLGRHFVETDVEGAFRFDTAPAGRDLQLLVSARGYGLTMVRVDAETEVARVVLEPSVPLEIRVVLAPDDIPLAEAQVLAAEEQGGARSPTTLLVGRTDAEGVVRFNASPGELGMVMISHPEHPVGMWNAQAPGSIPGMLEGPPDATIGPDGASFLFRVPGGRVVTGRIKTKDGAPIRGAEVEPFGGFALGRPSLTDEDGRYEVVVGRRTGLMVVRAHGFVTQAVQVSGAGEVGEVEQDVVLVRAAVVRGRVVDEDGRPVAGAQVKPHGAGGSGMALAGDLMEAPPSITGPSGRYVLTSFPPGEKMRVIARRAGYLMATSPTMEVEPGGSVRAGDIVLGTGESLAVTVTDPEGNPLTGAVVEVAYDSTGRVSWTGMDRYRGDDRGHSGPSGQVRFGGVPDGQVTLTASHDAWASGRAVVTIDEETRSPVRVTVAVRRSRKVEGRVLDEAGDPVEGASLYVQDAGGAWVNATSDAQGRFEIRGVPEGATVVQVNAPGYRNRQVPLEEAGVPLEIRLEALAPGVQDRIQELRERLMALSESYQGAKSDGEREAIQRELMQTSQELQRLQSGADGD